MNSYIKYIISFIIVIFVGTSIYFLYQYLGNSQNDFVDEPPVHVKQGNTDPLLTHVNIDENLIIDFEKPINPDTLREDSIQVFDEDENVVHSQVEFENDYQRVKILAPEEYYQKDHLYRIHIGDTVKYAEGNSQVKETNYYFKTERDPVEHAEFNQDVIFLEEDVFLEKDEDLLVLKKSEDLELHVDDVLILPIEEEGEQFEQAFLVTQVKQTKDTYELQYDTPFFDDIYDSIDLYGTAMIEEANFELADPSFTLETLHGGSIGTFYASTKSTPHHGEQLKNHPFRKEVPIEFNQVHKINLGSLFFDDEDMSVELGGEIYLLHPYIDYNIKYNWAWDPKDWLAFDVITHLGTEVAVDFDVSYSLFDANTNLANFSKDLRIGVISIPLPYGLSIDFEMILRVETDVNGEITVTTRYQALNKFGASLYKGNLNIVHDNISTEEKDSFGMDGKYQAKTEFGLGGGLTAFKSVGISLDSVVGADIEGGLYSVTQNLANIEEQLSDVYEDEVTASCLQSDYELYMRLLFNLGFRGKLRDGMMKMPINLGYDNKGDETELTLDKKGLEIALPKFTFAQKEKGNCVQLLGFIADPETLALPYDETDHIILKGQFIDVANKEVFERKLDLSEFTYKIDDDFMHADYEGDRFILQVVNQPRQKEGTLSITYEGDIHEQAKSTIEVPLEIEDFDELYSVVKKENKETMPVSKLEEESLYKFSSDFEGMPYHVYFYAENETEETLDLPSFLGSEGDRIVSGDYSFYLASEGDELAYKQEQLGELSYSGNREFDMSDTLELDDTTIFSVFENEGTRLKVPHSFMYAEGELHDLYAFEEIGYVYLTEFEFVDGTKGRATFYYMETGGMWRYLTFEVDVENIEMVIVDTVEEPLE